MSFENDFSIEDELIADINKVQMITALSISNDCIKDTPRDTGEAAGSWQIGIDKPPRKTRSKSRRPSGAAAENTRIIIKNSKDGALNDVYITSLKPYMQKLNRGHSAQSPGFFVENAVTRAGLNIEDIKLG